MQNHIQIYSKKLHHFRWNLHKKRNTNTKRASEHICSMSENGKLVAVENQYFFMQTKSGFPWYAKTGYSAL